MNVRAHHLTPLDGRDQVTPLLRKIYSLKLVCDACEQEKRATEERGEVNREVNLVILQPNSAV